MKNTHHKLNLHFTRCTVLTPLPPNFSTSRMPTLRSRLITSLYSAFICAVVFTGPTLSPSFPPFSIYRFLPDCNRNEILSRSNCAQVESVAIIIGAKRDGCPSSSNNVSCSLYVEVNATVNELLATANVNMVYRNLKADKIRKRISHYFIL